MSQDATKQENGSSGSSVARAEAHLQRTLDLLAFERDTDLAQMSLLASKCSPKLLEIRGLAILNLQVSSISIGLGGKTLVEMERWMKGSLPSHSFRNGDTCEILANTGEASGASRSIANKSKGKGKEPDASANVSGQGLQGIVYRVNDEKIIIALSQSKDSEEKDLDVPEKCRLQKLANTVTYDRMEKTIKTVLKSISPSSPSPSDLTQLLLGLRKPSISPLNDQDADALVFHDEGLNQSQRDAVKFAIYDANELALIHGPPGTGKTSTLIECIRQLVDKDKRVLVCAASNLAVDNILERLAQHLPSQSMSRIGHPARILANLSQNTLDYQTLHSNAGQITKELKDEIDELTKKLTNGKLRGKERREGWSEVRELRKEYRKREGAVTTGVLNNAKVVLATCHGAGSRQLYNMEFDVVIIDEAAQALEAVCWIPILKSRKKVILAGDHLQLPPTIKSSSEELPSALRKDKRASPQSLEVTLFDRILRAYGKDVKRLLNVQYRMHEKIMVFPSKELYDEELVAHESVASRLLSDLILLPNGQLVSGQQEDDGLLTEPVIFYDTAGSAMYERAEDSDSDKALRTVDGESKSNENEAELVMQFINDLTLAGVPHSSIAVISPYNAQVALVTSLIRDKYPADTLASDKPSAIEIGSVDGFQGREKDVVIVTLVRSNDKKEVGFLSEKRRLNVAMTRAKRCLCIIGDSETVANGGTFLKHWMGWLEENADVRIVE